MIFLRIVLERDSFVSLLIEDSGNSYNLHNNQFESVLCSKQERTLSHTTSNQSIYVILGCRFAAMYVLVSVQSLLHAESWIFVSHYTIMSDSESQVFLNFHKNGAIMKVFE